MLLKTEEYKELIRGLYEGSYATGKEMLIEKRRREDIQTSFSFAGGARSTVEERKEVCHVSQMCAGR